MGTSPICICAECIRQAGMQNIRIDKLYRIGYNVVMQTAYSG